MSQDSTGHPEMRPPLWMRQDFLGGLAIMAVAVFALWQSYDLPMGTLGGMGPGMLPRILAILLALLGLLLVIDSLMEFGVPIERWSIRAPIFLLGAVVAFGATVRPLGLALAGPLAIVIASLSSNESRWIETIVFGLLMTAFCIALFKLALGLPIPLAPWLLGY